MQGEDKENHGAGQASSYDTASWYGNNPYFCTDKIRQMTMWDKIQFFKSVSDYPFAEYADHVMHILCTAGNMSFTFQDVLGSRHYVPFRAVRYLHVHTQQLWHHRAFVFAGESGDAAFAP